MTSSYKSSLPLRKTDDPDSRVRELLADAQGTMGMVPNMYAGMANLPALLETYNLGYSLFRSDAEFSATEQEVVFLAISRTNSCHYCMAAHSALADMNKVPSDITDAIREDSPIADHKLEALRRFVVVMTESRGNPSQADAEAFLEAGYTERHIFAVILAISVKVISNYTNHIMHTEVDTAFSGRNWLPPS